MSYDTTVRATSEVDWRMMFLQARKAVGIPDEWPFDTEDDTVQVWCDSRPGGFAAAVHAYLHHFTAEAPDEGPRCDVDIRFVTCGDISEADVLHELYVQELGDWLTNQGVSFAVCDNRGEWVAA